jgi:hypothetical protein
MDSPSDSFLFVNKSTSSRTLSRSKAKEKAEIFRHVQRARQKHDGRQSKHSCRVDLPIRTFSTVWALPVIDLEGHSDQQELSRGTGNFDSGITRPDAGLGDQHYSTLQSPNDDDDEENKGYGKTDLTVSDGQDSTIQRLTGDGFDPFDAFPSVATYLPQVEGAHPYPVDKFARHHLLEYIENIDLTEFARKEWLSYGLARPTVMFSHLMMVVMEKEVADERLGVKLDRIFGTGALRHVRREIQDLQGPCPWDLICLVFVFMFRAQVSRLLELLESETNLRLVPDQWPWGYSKGTSRRIDSHDSTQRRASGSGGIQPHGTGCGQCFNLVRISDFQFLKAIRHGF